MNQVESIVGLHRISGTCTAGDLRVHQDHRAVDSQIEFTMEG